MYFHVLNGAHFQQAGSNRACTEFRCQTYRERSVHVGRTSRSTCTWAGRHERRVLCDSATSCSRGRSPAPLLPVLLPLLQQLQLVEQAEWVRTGRCTRLLGLLLLMFLLGRGLLLLLGLGLGLVVLLLLLGLGLVTRLLLLLLHLPQ